jgi:hypothetical protein
MRQINDQSQHKKQYGSTDLIVEIQHCCWERALAFCGVRVIRVQMLLNAPRMIELCAEPSIPFSHCRDVVTSRGVVPQHGILHSPLSRKNTKMKINEKLM